MVFGSKGSRFLESFWTFKSRTLVPLSRKMEEVNFGENRGSDICYHWLKSSTRFFTGTKMKMQCVEQPMTAGSISWGIWSGYWRWEVLFPDVFFYPFNSVQQAIYVRSFDMYYIYIFIYTYSTFRDSMSPTCHPWFEEDSYGVFVACVCLVGEFAYA